MVFKSKNGEAIADLLCVWLVASLPRASAHQLLCACTKHLVDLHNSVPFSPRLRRCVIYSVGAIGYQEFKKVGVERSVRLLNHLCVGVEDAEERSWWISLLLDTIRSPEGTQCLSNHSWKLLVELMISELELEEARYAAYSPQVMVFLLEAWEWDKLECWMGVVWMIRPPETDWTTEDLKRVMASLFHHRPGAAQKLTRWMKRWYQGKGVLKRFDRTCEQAYKAAQ